MKTAEEILNEILVDVENRPVFFREQDVVDLIEQAQKEAYNQALKDAIENATLSLFDWEDGGFKEHKRKDNKFIINDGNYVLIDKDSILELKK